MAAKLPIALQMYTVRDEAARDFAGTLAQVARIGYAGVELGGYPGRDPSEVRRLLDENGLIAVTRDTAHFAAAPVPVLDPWTATFIPAGGEAVTIENLEDAGLFTRLTR